MLLSTSWFGVFLLDAEVGTVIKKELFPKKVPGLVERLNMIRKGELLSEEQAIVKDLKEPFMVTEKRLRGLGEFVEAVVSLPENISLSAEEFGFDSELYREMMLEFGKQRTRESVAKDYYIIQAIKGLDDLTQTANLLSERLHEWYGLHFPELEHVVKETEYVDLISELGDRDTIVGNSKNEKLHSLNTDESIGASFDPEDKTAVMGFAEELKNVISKKTILENYIKIRMESLAPNITTITGPIIGARLIALTGGLERLARVTSSTVQLLGAEKALFRHLRDGELPPKHGIIFQHPTIHNAPYWQRGKIARALAGKIAIAAKVDHNSDKLMGEELVSGLKRRVEEIRKKYPSAPAKKQWRKHKKPGDEKWSTKKDKRGKKGKKTRRGGKDRRRKGKR